MATDNTPDQRWPLVGTVRVKGSDKTSWYFYEPRIGLNDRPLAWLKNHHLGNLHEDLIEQARDHGLRKKLYFRADESGVVTDTSKIEP